MTLQYTLTRDGDASSTVALAGDLTFAQNKVFRDLIEAVASTGARRLVIDLGKLRMIDSAGLSMLVLLHGRLQGGGGRITLRQPPAQISRALQVVAFDKLFEIIP